MMKNFDKIFDDFVMERMGEDAALLKTKNEKYRTALSEYSELMQKSRNGGVDDYKQAFERLAELSEYIRDLENHYFYYAGMMTCKKIDGAISDFTFPENPTE